MYKRQVMMNRDIKNLLEKYWICETTLEEERELYRFFTEDTVPESLQEYKYLFLLKSEEQKEALNDSFDKQILDLLKEVEEKEVSVRRRRLLHPFWQVVASVVVLLLFWFTIDLQIQKNDPWRQETYETPEQALAEIQKVLSAVSDHIEKGQALVGKKMEKMDSVTQIFK